MPRLTVKSAGASRTVELGDEAVSLGRTPDNTIPVDDIGASRKHAQILFIGRGYEVVDLGSRNGTKVNGVKVPRAVLRHGDVIAIGAFEIVFEEGDGGADAGGLEIEELDLGGGAGVPAAAPARGGGGAPAPVGACVLRIVDGERKGEEVPLKGARVTLGRRATNTVSYQDSSVSGVHCEITREANGYVLRDLGSTNGTLVDGEPVVETLLRHNSRIRVGAQRLVFVDTSVADIESSLSTADDGDGWGMMRGDLDVAAASRGRGRGALAAGVVVILAGAAAAFAVLGRGATRPEVEPVKDNRIEEHAFSFEDGVVRWFSADEEGGAAARIEGALEKPRAKSGVLSLAVSGAAPARVALGGDAFPVTADTSYEVSAAVGSGKGSVLVTWLSSTRPGLVRVSSTPPVDGGSDWPASAAVLTAPAQATAARLELVAWDGAAGFDDIVFRPVAGAPATFEGTGDLKLRVLGGGRLEAVRAGEVLLTDAGLSPSLETPEMDLVGAILDGAPASAGGKLSAAGRLPGDGGGFRLEVDSAPGGARLLCTSLTGKGAFTFTFPPGAMRGGLTLVFEKSAAGLGEQDRVEFSGVRKLIVSPGAPGQPFQLSAPPGSPGFDLAAMRTARGLRVRLAPPGGASPEAAAVLLAVDLSLEEAGGRDLLAAAEQFRARGELGQALAAYGRVAAEFHYLAALRDRATGPVREIETDADARLRELRRLLKSGKQFRSIPGLEDVAWRAKRLAGEFEGHPRAEEATSVAAAADEALAEARVAAVEQRVDALYREAVAREESGEVALARALFEEIVRVAPADNDFVGPSKERARGLAEKATAASARQFKGR